MPIHLPIRNMAGQQVGTIELSEKVFGVKRNDTLIHQVVVAQQANKRVGTASTKTRGDMEWGGAKPWRQKGTGRARQGSRTAPQWRGGGVVWGPHPRDYRQRTPRKMRRGALRSLLSCKVRDQELIVLDELRFNQPKTKAMLQVLQNLGVDNALLVLTDNCTNVRRSASNIPKIDTTRAADLNVLEVITRRYLIMPVEALRQVEQNLIDDNRRLRRLAEETGVPVELRHAAPTTTGNGAGASAALATVTTPAGAASAAAMGAGAGAGSAAAVVEPEPAVSAAGTPAAELLATSALAATGQADGEFDEEDVDSADLAHDADVGPEDEDEEGRA